MHRVTERLERELLYLRVEAREVLRQMLCAEKEDVRLKAVRTVEELSGRLKGGGNTSIQVVNPITEISDEMSDEEFLDRWKAAKSADEG